MSGIYSFGNYVGKRPKCFWGLFPRGKAAGARSSPLTST